MPEFADLATGLERLACLVGLADPLDQVLGQVAQCAMVALRLSDAVSVALVVGGRPALFAATDPRARAADIAQWELTEGPALTTVSRRRLTTSGSLRHELDWPRWATEVMDRGLHSVMVAPMMLAPPPGSPPGGDTLVGTITVFAQRENAFGPEAVEQLQRFARPAATVVHNLRLLLQSQLELEQLRAAVRTNAGTESEPFAAVASVGPVGRIGGLRRIFDD